MLALKVLKTTGAHRIFYTAHLAHSHLEHSRMFFMRYDTHSEFAIAGGHVDRLMPQLLLGSSLCNRFPSADPLYHSLSGLNAAPSIVRSSELPMSARDCEDLCREDLFCLGTSDVSSRALSRVRSSRQRS